MKEIELNKIKPCTTNPRRDLGELEKLVDSIKNVGLLQPLVVRKLEDDTYQLIIGRRRYEACKMLKLKTVPCVIQNVDDREALKIAVLENVHRKDNEWWELAEACKILRGKLVQQKGAVKKYEKTAEEIAKELSITKKRVWKYLSAKEVLDELRLRSGVVKDYTTLDMIHAIPKKDWKDAVNYVIKNNTSRADFDKKIDSAEKVKHRIEFLEITHPDIAKIIRDFWWKYKFENIYKDMCDEINIRIGQPTSEFKNIPESEMDTELAKEYAKQHMGKYLGTETMTCHRVRVVPRTIDEIREKWKQKELQNTSDHNKN